jgi:hypothetical protein
MARTAQSYVRPAQATTVRGVVESGYGQPMLAITIR